MLLKKSLFQILFIFLLFKPFSIWCIPEESLKIFPPMDQIYHPVSTQNIEAQKSFDKGLTFIFAFNHDLAFHEFEKASKFDPNLAMAYWGMALALGQNINSDITKENEIKCYQYIQHALQLSSNASENERAYISALADRYTNNPNRDLIALRYRYRDAMKKVVQSYSEDLDAATLYAESILDLDPWKWWTPDGKPREGTYEAIDKLEFVLGRNPDHIGANHYYIHALEESPFPQRALMSAHRLEFLLPESGHLLHMPTHIFLLVGDYESALRTNKKAIEQDRHYIKEYGVLSGPYPLHYLSHNLAIQTRIYMLREDYQNAIQTAFDLVRFIEPHIEMMPNLANSTKIPLDVYLYFHKWQEILNYTIPSKNPTLLAYLHFSRAVAYASLGDLDTMQKEKELMNQFKKMINSNNEIANNPEVKLIDLSSLMLEATIAQTQNKTDAYINYLIQAMEMQDSLYFDEPSLWYQPIRQVLGFALLKQQKYSEAELLFRKTLQSLQRNGRSLFGLFLSLKGQERIIDAYWVQREMEAALKNSMIPLQYGL